MGHQHYHLDALEALKRQPRACLSEQARAANRAVTRFYARYLKDCDIGIAQLALLVRLYYVREAGMGQLASDLELDRTTLARTVQTLVNSGHLSVSAGQDRRSRLVRLTDKGFESLRQAVPRWQQAQAELRGLIGDSGWATAWQSMRLLVHTLGLPEED